MPDKAVYYRLVALWVVCEAMLGGIIHGLKLPVSGLFVGGMAVFCISMIGYYYPVKGAIIKATIIVAIFKMMLSPQSPAPAYLAVFFQGIIGQMIFMNNKSWKSKCILFATIALVESGVQRLFVMTLLFGMDIWKAIDIYINGITRNNEVTNYSYYIAAGYVFLHVIAGILIGWFSGSIPLRIKNEANTQLKMSLLTADSEIEVQKKRNTGLKKFIPVLWIILVLIFLHSYIYPDNSVLPSNMVIKLLLRSALIIFTWLLINPYLVKLIHRWLEKKKTESASDIQIITELLPATQRLVRKSWKHSSSKKGIMRLPFFMKIVLYNSLVNE